jgi:hypothetical protein
MGKGALQKKTSILVQHVAEGISKNKTQLACPMVLHVCLISYMNRQTWNI